MSNNILKTALLGAAAAVSLGVGTFVTAAPAEAQVVQTGPVYRGGAFRGGYVGGYRGGYVGGSRVVVNRGYYGSRHGYGYGYRPYRNNGGAVAAGLIGGLALGAIAANSYNYGGYGYGYAPATYGYGYAPATYGYGYAPVTYGGGCYIERRTRINRFGERVIRDVQVCR